jgi:hypothetical protein
MQVQLARRVLRPILRRVFYVISQVEISGKENAPSHGASRREMLRWNADAGMLKIADLLPPEYHSFYQEYANDNRKAHQ